MGPQLALFFERNFKKIILVYVSVCDMQVLGRPEEGVGTRITGCFELSLGT